MRICQPLGSIKGLGAEDSIGRLRTANVRRSVMVVESSEADRRRRLRLPYLGPDFSFC